LADTVWEVRSVNQSFDPIETPVGVFIKEVLLKRWDGIYFLVLTGVFAILTLFPSLPVFWRPGSGLRFIIKLSMQAPE
jgi:hypothetical protein